MLESRQMIAIMRAYADPEKLTPMDKAMLNELAMRACISQEVHAEVQAYARNCNAEEPWEIEPLLDNRLTDLVYGEGIQFRDVFHAPKKQIDDVRSQIFRRPSLHWVAVIAVEKTLEEEVQAEILKKATAENFRNGFLEVGVHASLGDLKNIPKPQQTSAC